MPENEILGNHYVILYDVSGLRFGRCKRFQINRKPALSINFWEVHIENTDVIPDPDLLCAAVRAV